MKPRRRVNPYVKLSIGLVVVGGVGAAVELRPRPPVEVAVVQVTRGSVRDVASSSTAGEVTPLSRALIRTEVPGRVLRRAFDRGQTVKRNEVVVALDPTELDVRIKEARAAVAAAQVGVTQADVALKQAEDLATRNVALFQRQALGAEQRDSALSARDGAKAALAAARARVTQVEAALATARVLREKADLRAPFDGLLVDVVPYPGDELILGAPVFEIIDATRLRVEANLDEADASRVKVGQPAEITLDALPGKVLAASVAQVGPALRRDAKGARVMPIRVDVADAAELRAGMGANVRIVVAERRDVLFVPSNAVVGRGVTRSAWVVAAGRAQLRPIKVGLSDWERTEVLGGVADRDQVITTLNAKGLVEGAPVKVAGAPAKP
ncbi:MAG TPA: efflux RND transporter periplasmic adaptor subunit [Polyangia bacterium]|jgi:HlyD family secretion protein